jgi:hypothetical protein
MAIEINFVLFERTFKVIYEDLLQLFLPCLENMPFLWNKSAFLQQLKRNYK